MRPWRRIFFFWMILRSTNLLRLTKKIDISWAHFLFQIFPHLHISSGVPYTGWIRSGILLLEIHSSQMFGTSTPAEQIIAEQIAHSRWEKHPHGARSTIIQFKNPFYVLTSPWISDDRILADGSMSRFILSWGVWQAANLCGSITYVLPAKRVSLAQSPFQTFPHRHIRRGVRCTGWMILPESSRSVIMLRSMQS